MTELEKAKAFNQSIKEALTIVYNALNKGQQQKLMKDDKVREMFERYHVLEESNGDN